MSKAASLTEVPQPRNQLSTVRAPDPLQRVNALESGKGVDSPPPPTRYCREELRSEIEKKRVGVRLKGLEMMLKRETERVKEEEIVKISSNDYSIK